MSDASNYLETSIVNHFFRNSSVTAPTAAHCALFTAVTDAEAGTGTEVTGGGYGRQTVTFGAPSNGVTSNSASVAWTASGANYGTVSHFAIFDAASGGNALTIIKALSGGSKVVNDGDTATFAASALTLTVA